MFIEAALAIALNTPAKAVCDTDANCAAYDVMVAGDHGVKLAYDPSDPAFTPFAEITPNGGIRLSCAYSGDTLYDTGYGMGCETLSHA